MNLYKREIYKSQLQHGLEWKRHKYLYKDANGNYVYPEDVKNNAKSKVQGFVADQKQKLKDKKYLRDEKHRKYPNLEKANVTSTGGKRVNQITSAHQEGTKKTTALSYQSTHDPISNKVVKVKRDFDSNGNQIGVGYSTEPSHLTKKKQRNKIDQQRKSAHAGYEADKKLFPEGGSTEELEYQKKRTASRKADKKYKEERRKINQQAQSAHEGFWEAPYNLDSVATEELKRQKEKTKARKERKESHGTNKQRAAGKAQLNKIHNKAKAEKSATNLKTDWNAEAFPVTRIHYPKRNKSNDWEQSARAHQRAIETKHDEKKDVAEMRDRWKTTSDTIERQKHKTRLRRLKERRGK